MRGVAVQIDGYDPVEGKAVTLRAASHDLPDICALDNKTWWPAIATLPKLRYDLFDGSFAGQIAAPAASMSLSTEPWPLFARYGLADAQVSLWTGEIGQPWSAWTLRLQGRSTARPQVKDGRAELSLAVDDRWLDTALLATYAGTTKAEGPSALKGTPKPLALGAPRYAPGTLIDSVNSVFQVSSYGPIRQIEAALEKAIRYGAPIADYPNYDALVAATIPRGTWATALAVGMARFGAPPEGKVSFLLQGDQAGPDGWARLPGQIIRRLALLAGGAGRIDDASLNALDAARPYPQSIYLEEQTTARELIQRIAASVNAVAGVSWTGKLFVLPVELRSPTLTLATDGSALPPVGRVDQLEIDAPWKRLAAQSERTWAVHDLSEIAFTAPLIDRGRFDPAETYREGNIADLADGSRWLFVGTTPAKGEVPRAGSAVWSSMAPPTAAADIKYGDGSTLEAMKPAEPGSTNSADPNSPFGPGGTVGGTVQKLSDIDTAIATAKARQDKVDNETIPAINAAVTDAGDRITAARNVADRALDGVGAANTRIDDLIAEGGGGSEGVDTVARAEIRRVDKAYADADIALTGRIDTIQAGVDTVDNRIDAKAQEVTTAYTQADKALASRASVLEAAASATSTSVVPNDNFNVWPDGQALPTRWGYWAVGGSFRVDKGSPGRGGGQYCVITLNDATGVDSGFVQTIYSSGPGKWVVEVTIGKLHGYLSGSGLLIGNRPLDFLAEPDIEGETRDSWDGEVRSWSSLIDLDAGDTINVHAMHGWGGFGRTIMPKYIAWHCLRLRPANDAEIKAGKADAALFGTDGVLARIKTSEDTLADLPNRYAAASRVGALESQVNGATDSGLLRTVSARIEDRATAIASEKAGAVAQTVQTLRTEYDQTYGQVQQQAGAISGINGRTSVYWSVTGTTPDGQTKLSLSKQDGSPGLFYVQANVLFDGDLVVNGTLRPKSFDKSSMSREARTSWSGSVTPGAGQEVGLPGLGLPVISPLGRFIYEVGTNVSSNAGTRENTSYNGKPAYIDYIADGGLLIRAIDGQGNAYVPRPNSSDTVLATTAFEPNFAVAIRAGNTDSGWVDGGDFYRRQVSATYTVFSYDLRVLWVAI